MLKQQKLFLSICVPFRILLVLVAKYLRPEYLVYMGYLMLFPAIGFAAIYLTNSSKTGLEVFGGKIWWNDLRPFHSLLYFAFAYNAIVLNNKSAWIYLLADVILGISAFLVHYYV